MRFEFTSKESVEFFVAHPAFCHLLAERGQHFVNGGARDRLFRKSQSNGRFSGEYSCGHIQFLKRIVA